MQGQTGIAKKVYECVPISEPWRSFQVLTALRNMTGSTPDVRIVQGCLRDLVDSGLIRRTGTDHYQRIQVEKKTKPQEPKMGEPAKKIETQPEPKRSSSPLEMLGELANELVGMAEHMKRLSDRIEDVALAVEQERESNAKSMESYRQLKALYMHGYRNGVSDRTGVPHERAEVLRRRAEMIPGITPHKVWFQGRAPRD